MRSNKYGEIILNAEDAFAGLYSGKLKNLNNVLFDLSTEVEKFNVAAKENFDDFGKLTVFQEDPNVDRDFFDEANQCDWFMPEDKIHHNLVEMLYGMCETKEQRDRVDEELTLFIQHGMLDLLFYLKYLVDTMREHNIVWGVGRGSSVASYVLYLIGVHKVDSLKYKLDIHEFLK